MASFFALKGFQAQLKYMMEKERLLFSIGEKCNCQGSACQSVDASSQQLNKRNTHTIG